MDSLLEDLNDAQREAVRHQGGALLVVAGAGSGKTRVVTRRIAWRIARGTPPGRILAITFTNRAAGEMRERVRRLTGGGASWISTFHAFGARVLRLEATAAGVDPNFTIFDADDRLQLVRHVLEERGIDPRLRRPRDCAHLISNLKRRGVEAPAADEPVDDVDLEIYRDYERALSESRGLDFDDLLVRVVRLFKEDEEARRRVADRFDTVLVDEYQDTNRLQYELIRLLVRDHGDVCATGDPDQSIYRWRGADLRNILDFERDFPGAKVVKLELNYRSTNRILRAASALIAHNTRRVERDLRSSLGEGERVRLRSAWSERDEARLVVDGVEEALADGWSLDDVAIFYRTNACSRPLEQELRERNVPYVIVGAVEFYERREVKDLVAYLRVLANPHDRVDLQRIAQAPRRGIGPKTMWALLRRADATGTAPRDLLLSLDDVPDLRPQARRALTEFGALLRELLELRDGPVGDLLDAVIERTGYRDHLRKSDDPLLDERLENVEELRRAVRAYDLQHPDGGLEGFLAETALVRSRDRVDEAGPHVTLMTLHSAKGLEFPVVFIVSLEEGVLPHSRCLDSEEELEEERRLLYVGMTRAMRRLTLTHARARTGAGPAYGGTTIPSRFLAEIPPEWLEGDAVPLTVGSRFDEDWYEPDLESGEVPFHPGDRVAHPKFGAGRVLEVSGRGAGAKIRIDFDLHGTRLLLLEYTQLRKAYGGAS